MTAPGDARADRADTDHAGRADAESAAASPDPAGDVRWAVVIPVKPATIGKSRLDVPGVDREALARAIALDTIAAVRAARSVAAVIVVTDDPGVADALRGDAQIASGAPGTAPSPTPAPARLVPDPGAGLNAAIAAGLEAAQSVSPGPGVRPAALLGDLPALRPADLDGALGLAAAVPGPSVVADADGTGTTLLAGAEARVLRFGAGSFAAHVAAGAAPLRPAPPSTLRHDVDTAAQLAAARQLGLGPRTAALLD